MCQLAASWYVIQMIIQVGTKRCQHKSTSCSSISREQIWDFPASFEDQKISEGILGHFRSFFGIWMNLTCLAGKSTFLILSLHDLQLNVRVFPCLHKHKSPRRSTECLGMCLAHQPALRCFERTGNIAQKRSFGLFNIANKYAWSCLVVEPNLQKNVN